MTEEARERKKAYDKLWREKHKEEIKAYREAHKEKIKSQIENYKKTHKEEISEQNKAYQKKYRIEHKDEIQAYNKSEAVRLRVRQYNKVLQQRAKELTTDMYKFPADVIILNSRSVKFKDKTYTIGAKGYLRGNKSRLHIDIAKDMGIWYEGCEIHHIDGSAFNNTRDNLISLTSIGHRYAHELMKENIEAYYEWINKIRE